MFKFFNLLHKKITSSKKYYSFGCIDAIVGNIFKDKNNDFYVDVGC